MAIRAASKIHRSPVRLNGSLRRSPFSKSSWSGSTTHFASQATKTKLKYTAVGKKVECIVQKSGPNSCDRPLTEIAQSRPHARPTVS